MLQTLVGTTICHKLDSYKESSQKNDLTSFLPKSRKSPRFFFVQWGVPFPCFQRHMLCDGDGVAIGDLCHRNSMATSRIQVHVIRSDAGGNAQPQVPEVSFGFRLDLRIQWKTYQMMGLKRKVPSSMKSKCKDLPFNFFWIWFKWLQLLGLLKAFSIHVGRPKGLRNHLSQGSKKLRGRSWLQHPEVHRSKRDMG